MVISKFLTQDGSSCTFETDDKQTVNISTNSFNSGILSGNIVLDCNISNVKHLFNDSVNKVVIDKSCEGSLLCLVATGPICNITVQDLFSMKAFSVKLHKIISSITEIPMVNNIHERGDELSVWVSDNKIDIMLSFDTFNLAATTQYSRFDFKPGNLQNMKTLSESITELLRCIPLKSGIIMSKEYAPEHYYIQKLTGTKQIFTSTKLDDFSGKIIATLPAVRGRLLSHFCTELEKSIKKDMNKATRVVNLNPYSYNQLIVYELGPEIIFVLKDCDNIIASDFIGSTFIVSIESEYLNDSEKVSNKLNALYYHIVKQKYNNTKLDKLVECLYALPMASVKNCETNDELVELVKEYL